MNNNMSNSMNNNNNDVVEEVHKIPRKGPGGLSPWVAINVYNGVYNDDTAWVFDELFAAARWREAVEANAESRGVAVIREE
jgi:hypothetical protein